MNMLDRATNEENEISHLHCTKNEEILNGKLKFFVQCWKKIVKRKKNFHCHNSSAIFRSTSLTLREKCPNTEFFLVHIFLYSD